VSAVEYELEDGFPVIVREMLPVTRATDLFLDDLTSRGYSARTVDSYRRLLNPFGDSLRDDPDIGQVTEDDVRKFFTRFNRHAPGTRAHAFSVLSSFFKWLYFAEKIKRNPMDRMVRPKRVPPEDLDVLTLSTADVRTLLEMAESWPERLAINVLAYLGPRRRAVARLRLKDYDQTRGRLRFKEKGGKVIWKTVPTKLAAVIDAAIAAGIYPDKDAYLVPSEGPTLRPERDDRVIWNIIKRLAWRAGIDAHVHALRAAFAVYYLEQGGDVLGLQDLLGHRSAATTQVYLRKRNREAGMEPVRTLDWGDNTDPAEIVQIAEKRLDASP